MLNKPRFGTGSVFLSAIFLATLLASSPLFAQKPDPEVSKHRLLAEASLKVRLKKEISRLYPNTDIEFHGGIQWVKGNGERGTGSLEIVRDDLHGTVYFSNADSNTLAYSEGSLRFSAWMTVWIPTRRILPLEPLMPSLFNKQNIDVSTGQAREMKGLLVSDHFDITGTEATQTIIEGQPLISSAIRKIPDIRKGDAIRIELKSKDISLSTAGIAEEPAYINQQLRVMTLKNKRELVGRLQPGGIVEVNL